MLNEVHGGYVQTETHGSITTIEFHHPAGNSMPAKLLEELAHAIHGAGNENDTKVIVLRSGGTASFCAGASFTELGALTNVEEAQKFFEGFAHVINAMRTCPKFLIARVHGRAVGGGVGIIAAADYAIAVENADIKLSELSIGIGPFVIGPVVQRRIGLSAFSHLAIDASMWRNAEWAKRKGLYAEVHNDVNGMDESISRLATSLTQANPSAVSELKRCFWEGSENWDLILTQRAAISGRLALSEFTKQELQKLKHRS
ncbi:MAG: enoyl-CoA hydratase/isomerase family protein [Sphingobacteriales bacterium]|nr:MAG: enoyl-CoA hydratase/isomerase family protein [Sphingobacteriales bacterium]